MDPLCVPSRELLPNQVSPGASLCGWEVVVELMAKAVYKSLLYPLSYPHPSKAAWFHHSLLVSNFCHSRWEQNGRVKSQTYSFWYVHVGLPGARLCNVSDTSLLVPWSIGAICVLGALTAQLNSQAVEAQALQGKTDQHFSCL